VTPGIYHLILHLAQDETLQIGKLDEFKFPAGYYVYTGSALNGLEKRIARHQRNEKRLHWHIDYLLQHARIVDIITHHTTQRLECQFNRNIQSLPNSEIPAKGFGSSDCKCISHLTYFLEKPNIPQNI
jgi:Uri superfamily endonuclease